MQDNKTQTKKIIHKASRTLVINTENEISTTEFTGLINSFKSNNNSQFFMFDNIENSKSAFKILKNNNNKVRFAYYRIFFTMKGLDDNISYNDLKEQHIKWITSNSDAQVLYYKQYRNGGKYLGCGDFTVDTKESMDKLLDKNTLKNYSFDKYTGVNYKYNKKNEKSEIISDINQV
jgi:hypothetical protein